MKLKLRRKDFNVNNLKLDEITVLELPSTVEEVLLKNDIKNIIHVPSNLHYHGFDYVQVCRGRRSCLFRQTLRGKTVGFEVFLIIIQPEINIDGTIIPSRERWPKDEDFGKTAWSCFTHEEALYKYNELEESYIGSN